MQEVYVIQVVIDFDFKKANLVWDIGKIILGILVFLFYEGKVLAFGQCYYWWVKVWSNQGEDLDWFVFIFWEMGLLCVDDWQAKWIELVQVEEKDGFVYLLWKVF